MNRLAVMDWGIGGLGFYRSWKQHRPDDSIVYFSDSGFTPYGKLSEEDLSERLNQIFKYLKAAHAVTHIVVACNAASSVLNKTRTPSGIETDGVIDSTVEFIRETLADKPLTVLGGNRIVDSQTYSKLLPELVLHEKAAQPLSAIVERGDCYG